MSRPFGTVFLSFAFVFSNHCPLSTILQAGINFLILSHRDTEVTEGESRFLSSTVPDPLCPLTTVFIDQGALKGRDFYNLRCQPEVSR